MTKLERIAKILRELEAENLETANLLLNEGAHTAGEFGVAADAFSTAAAAIVESFIE